MLTVGIPTYNRADNLLALVRALLQEIEELPVHILVIDDGSTDATADKVRRLVDGRPECQVVRHDGNLGYPRTFLDVFAQCRTEYLLLASDDDEIVPGGLRQLSESLASGRPDFVSSQFFGHDGRCIRGMPTAGAIQPQQLFLAANHAPGLVYRVPACDQGLNRLSALIDANQEIALVWPQVVLVASLLASGKCVWWPHPAMRLGASLPSGIQGAGGRSIGSFASRWDCLVSLHRYLDDELQLRTDPREQRALVEMRETNLRRVYAGLRQTAALEDEVLLQAFDQGARRHALRLYLKQVVRPLQQNNALAMLRRQTRE